jgi:hypothetical protein
LPGSSSGTGVNECDAQLSPAMFKHKLLNLLLLVILLVLATTIYFSEEPDDRLPLLTDADPGSITSIDIQHNNSRTSISRQADDHWQITQPITIAANNFRISSILKLLNAPVHKRYALDEIDTDRIGLKNPDTTIQLDAYNIAFGITNPATNLRYVRLDDAVYTIEDVYYPLLSSFFGTLVSLNLLPPDSKIEKLILLNQTIAKDDKGRWQSNIDFSADNMVSTMQRWQTQQAFGIHQYMQREPLGEVFIYLKGQEQPISYVVTDTDPWLIIARPELGLEYHLDIENYKLLLSPTNGDIPQSTDEQ